MSILRLSLGSFAIFFLSCTGSGREYVGVFPPWLRDLSLANGYWEQFPAGEGSTWLAIDDSPDGRSKIAWFGSSSSISVKSQEIYDMTPLGHGEFVLSGDGGKAIAIKVDESKYLIIYKSSLPILPVRSLQDVVDWIESSPAVDVPLLFEMPTH